VTPLRIEHEKTREDHRKHRRHKAHIEVEAAAAAPPTPNFSGMLVSSLVLRTSGTKNKKNKKEAIA
jgi:hypothetical protein